jgi:hypothetical protein
MLERFAVIYSDGSMTILPENATLETAREERALVEYNEDEPRFTQIARVTIQEIHLIYTPSPFEAPLNPGEPHE